MKKYENYVNISFNQYIDEYMDNYTKEAMDQILRDGIELEGAISILSMIKHRWEIWKRKKEKNFSFWYINIYLNDKDVDDDYLEYLHDSDFNDLDRLMEKWLLWRKDN